jgi:hypothetical protein
VWYINLSGNATAKPIEKYKTNCDVVYIQKFINAMNTLLY